MSFAKLDALGQKLEAIEHAISILSADEATNMPSGGGEKRFYRELIRKADDRFDAHLARLKKQRK